MSERGQLTVAAVGLMVVLVLGAAVLLHLGRIRAQGAAGQRAADIAALAAARTLGDDPAATVGDLRAAASTVAAANGAHLVWLRIERGAAGPAAVDLAVRVEADDTLAVVGSRADQVLVRARAGVSYSAALPASSFRPVDPAGASGAGAAVAAAEAQIGWPYVWGGESRAEGGFDCSGLVDYAYAAAGIPLPGRPTAADLWTMSTPIPAVALAPGDLVFLGARSGAPYHVGMYVGGDMTVVAPHSGAAVEFEPLSAVAWDGFGTLSAGTSAVPVGVGAVEAAARRYQVPPDVLQAELDLGVSADADAAGRSLAAAARRHPDDVVAALTDALGGDSSSAALVVRAASGPGLGAGFSGSVRLLPVPIGGAEVAAPGTRGSRGARATGWSVGAPGQSALAAGSKVADWLEEVHGRGAVGGFAGVHHISRLGLNAATLYPDRRVSTTGSVLGAAWDVGSSAMDVLADGLGSGLAVGGLGLWASRLTVLGGAVSLAFGGYALYEARTRRQRVVAAAQTVAGGLTVAGFATAGGELCALGAASMEVPPVGLTLLCAATVITAGVTLYQNWSAIRGAAAVAGSSASKLASRAASTVSDAAGAAVDGARSLVSSIPTPW
jgi:cell wall-associated NlpC family hydrolase